jgi:flavin-dependent dehydrogenase
MSASIDIYGAGLSGLVAAIHLAREGFDVRLFDRHKVGGNPEWNPSIQTTVLNPQQMWEYIGMDLSDCFRRVNSITFYRYGCKKTFILENMYICERGPRKGSLETCLHERAADAGVAFHLIDRLGLSFTPQNTIIATGLEANVYKQLNIPHVPIYGYRGVKKTERDRALVSYMYEWTNYDFAYLAADRQLLFALLFSRQGLTEDSLAKFRRTLEATEGIQFDKWTYSIGAIPIGTQLFHNELVLAGTLSGMIDPFLLHGISGALTSGKIAAQAFMDRDAAIREFRWLAKNFELKKRLKALSVRLPLKQVTLPLMMLVDSKLRGVGFI